VPATLPEIACRLTAGYTGGCLPSRHAGCREQAAAFHKGGDNLPLESLGRHLLIELRDCDVAVLQDLERVRDILVEAARAAGATIVSEAFYQFAPYGISGMVIIAESHLSIHTWPEHRYAAADIFTCGDLLLASDAVDILVQNFGSLNPAVMEVSRGLLGPGEMKIPHQVVTPEEVHS